MFMVLYFSVMCKKLLVTVDVSGLFHEVPPNLCSGDYFSIFPLFYSLQVFCACLDLLCELGAPRRDWLCLHSSQELAALGVLSPGP